ncbi:Paf1 domain containing protein [Trichuris trichiura]|uniref:RNA polymerase II-associated factor 1 homolog n=1 Tax=Trichuris trichiura TaxID=36087 RepID=A0A077ZL69_TRITR|nr:Paf1 domain containing protein [Trichuris trichiura]
MPDVPFETKFVPYPFDLKRYVPYKPTKLETSFKFDQLVEKDLEICFDLVTASGFKNDTSAPLDPVDQRLIEEEDRQLSLHPFTFRSKHHGLVVPWMRRTEYISSDFGNYSRLSAKARIKLGLTAANFQEETPVYRSRESQLQAIGRTFEEVEKARLEKPGLAIIEEMPILPDFEMWKLACAQVIFDVDPTPKDMDPLAEVNVEKFALISDDTQDEDYQYFQRRHFPLF